MNADIHLEHRADSSQGKHEGEPSLGLCDRLNRTRDNSQRQLPTDHDYAVPTREYQTDQSSLKTAPTAARSVFGKGKQRQRQPHCCAELTRSLHIRAMPSFRGFSATTASPPTFSMKEEVATPGSETSCARSKSNNFSHLRGSTITQIWPAWRNFRLMGKNPAELQAYGGRLLQRYGERVR